MLAAVALVLAGWLFFGGPLPSSLRERVPGGARLGQQGEAPAKSIAVLPFASLSEDKANAYFAEGIQDEILTRLAKIGDLKVISRTSTLRYKSAPENLLEIAKQLGVAHVLEGSVQKSGDRVRINVQLINAQTDAHLWAETYDRTLTDVFAVESEVAQRVADSLRATLTGVEKATLAAQPTENPAAYDAYLRGLAVVASNRESVEAFTSAADFFEEAVRLDPGFGLAWARASIAHSRMHWVGYDRSPARAEKAWKAAEKAEALQPDLGETFLAHGYYEYLVVRNYEAAWLAFKDAVSRLPNNADALVALSFIERRKGKWSDALAHQEQAARLDPQNLPGLSQLGLTYFAMKRFADAHALVDRLLALVPGNPQVLAGLARLDLSEGNLAAAEAAMRSVAPMPNNDYIFEIQVRLALIAARYDDANRLVEGAFAQPAPPTGFFAGKYRFLLGLSKQLAGDTAGARTIFEQARGNLQKVLEAQPDSAEAQMYLGFVEAPGSATKKRRSAPRKSRLPCGPLPSTPLPAPRSRKRSPGFKRSSAATTRRWPICNDCSRRIISVRNKSSSHRPCFGWTRPGARCATIRGSKKFSLPPRQNSFSVRSMEPRQFFATPKCRNVWGAHAPSRVIASPARTDDALVIANFFLLAPAAHCTR